MIDLKKLKKYRGRNAVSPVVATLILIIVAIVGAVAVGLIVSGIGSQTQKSASAQGAAGQASTTIVVGGSTTLFPAVLSAVSAFDSTHPGILVNVTQGGSGAGMTGVALGVLDIGDASSFSAVTTGISQFPTANLQAQEVGGSGVVFFANWGATLPACSDGITLKALQALYTAPGGQVGAPTCGTGDANQTIEGWAAGTTYTAVSRSDLPSGTEDTACAFLTTTVCATTSNNEAPLPGVTQAGNALVLGYVQGHTNTIGFADIGFAEGKTADIAAGVTILQANSTAITTKLSACTSAGSFNCFALPGGVTNSLDSYIKASLSNTSPSAATPVFPDATSGNGLTRTFWMVTKGAASTDEQAFINFMIGPTNQNFWNNQGYYSIYQILPITPP